MAPAAAAAPSAAAAAGLKARRSWADIARGPAVPPPAGPLAALPKSASATCRLAAAFAKGSSDEEPTGWANEPADPAAASKAWEDLAERAAPTFARRPCEDEPQQAPLASARSRPLRPGARGSRCCPCHGEVIAMLGHYGWLSVHDEIDHPDASKNGGRIYVHWRDVEHGSALVAGELVAFYLYVDHQGLGAEGCRLREPCPPPPPTVVPPGPNWGAVAFAPGLNAHAADFVPAARSVADLARFSPVPVLPTAAAVPAPVAPVLGRSFFAFNDAYLSDSDESSDEGACGSLCDGGRGHTESDGEQSVEPEAKVPTAAQRPGLHLAASRRTPRRVKSRTASHGSSSTSAASDSDAPSSDFAAMPSPGLRPAPGLCLGAFRPPPGLCLPG